MSKSYLSIMRCPKHPIYQAIAIEDEEGGGTRLTPDKCCGSWETIRRWEITERMKRDLLTEIECAP